MLWKYFIIVRIKNGLLIFSGLQLVCLLCTYWTTRWIVSRNWLNICVGYWYTLCYLQLTIVENEITSAKKSRLSSSTIQSTICAFNYHATTSLQLQKRSQRRTRFVGLWKRCCIALSYYEATVPWMDGHAFILRWVLYSGFFITHVLLEDHRATDSECLRSLDCAVIVHGQTVEEPVWINLQL